MQIDLALLIFISTYALIAVGRPPVFRIDRTGAALIGAALMIVCNVLDVEAAYRAVDYNTIILLFSLMIVVANLRLSGFFGLASSYVMSHISRPSTLLYAVIFLSGGLSALFINDTVCLAFTPLALAVTVRSGLNPAPFLLALCMSANIGSVATITGNPQNIMIGSFSGIGYARFSAKLLPVAVAGLVVCCLIIRLYYRDCFGRDKMVAGGISHRIHRPLLVKSILTSAVMITLFLAGLPMTPVAIGAAAYLLITRRIKPEKVYASIDWRLLVLFVGLFIVIEGVERSGLIMALLEAVGRETAGHPFILVTAAAVLSNLVSNVPAVLLIAMSSTLAGNLTILGSIANIIVVEGARRRVRIGFLEYMKIGVPVTVITLVIGTLWLHFGP
jgi:Na+/H+ antiporter NhaD/arsenite permease-like protein